MADVMFTIKSPDKALTVSDAAQKLGVTEADLDQSFGVILTDPQQHLYTVLVNENAKYKVKPADDTVGGPFSNPGIGTYHIQ